VIAYGRGAIRETVVEGRTGIFFNEQTPASLIAGIKHFETCAFDPLVCHQRAQLFSQEVFSCNFRAFVLEKYAIFLNRNEYK
jgi:hypothetical protein